MQEVLADLPANMRCYSTPAATVQLRAALARLEGEQLAPADCAAHRSLEVLRLEDPATMFGCWNPGCAAAFAIAGDGRLLKFIHLLAHVHVHKPADMQHAGMLICMMSADRGKC